MKFHKECVKIIAVLAGTCGALPAMAQSSVTLFGTLDTGITYVSNESGKHNLMMDDGIDGPNLWGMRGRDDLGGGTRAIFELVDQFHVENGEYMPDSSLFTRNSYVGLANDRYGKLTLGNQYDFMTDSLFFSGDEPAELSGHFYSFRAGPFQKLDLPDNATGSFDWDRMAGEVVNDSVKYLSPNVDGFTAGAMYRFGGDAGSVGQDNGVSFGLNYTAKDFSVNAAYTNLKYTVTGDPEISVQNWGVGAHYDWAAWTFAALFTTVHNSLNDGAVYEGSFGASYHITPALIAGASYMYMKGNAVVDNNHANQLAANVTYKLSKRTEVYALAVYQRANAGGSAQINGLNDDDDISSSNVQTVVRVGLRVRF